MLPHIVISTLLPVAFGVAEAECMGNDCPMNVNYLLQSSNRLGDQQPAEATDRGNFQEIRDSNKCGEGYSKLGLEECKKYADEDPDLGEVEEVNYGKYPGGCYRLGTRMRFNVANGKAHTDAQLICKSEACQCSGQTSPSNGQGGYCHKWDSDGVWCYVTQGTCSDEKSSTARSLYWSKLACEATDRGNFQEIRDSNNCGEGYSKLGLEECKKYADGDPDLDEVTEVNYGKYPGGCYRLSGNAMRFNKANGKAHSDAMLICKSVPKADCSANAADLVRGNDKCCTSSRLCNAGEGDCDSDSDCNAGLVCGTDNCPWGDGDDCCQAR